MQSSALVIKPAKSHSPTASDAALILAPANYAEGSLQSSEYRALAAQLQSAYEGSLWIGVLDYSKGNLDSSNFLSSTSNTVKELVSAGLDVDSANLFYGAHGDNARSALQRYLSSNANDAKAAGMVILGSFMNTTMPGNVFPSVPTLSLFAELDGVNFISHAALSVIQGKLTTVVIEGASHAQFAAGNLPSSAKNLDLSPEVSLEDAHAKVSSVVAAFMSSQIASDATVRSQATDTVKSLVHDSVALLQPMVDAFLEEKGRVIAPSCAILPPAPNCVQQTPFSLRAQHILAKEVTVVPKDWMWETERFYPHDYIPRCNNTDGVVYTGSITEHYYADGDANKFLSVSEVSIKLCSHQFVKKLSNVPYGTYEEEDGDFSCAGINKVVYDQALQQVPARIRDRFVSKGLPIVMVTPDYEAPASIEPLWYLHRLTFTPSGDHMKLQSSSFGLSASLPLIGGVHHCKLLSPARAMEYIYTEGLRYKSASSQVKSLRGSAIFAEE